MAKVNSKLFFILPVFSLLTLSCVKIFNFDKGGGGDLLSFSPDTPTPKKSNFNEFFQYYETTDNVTRMLVTSIKQDLTGTNPTGNIYTLAQLHINHSSSSPPGESNFSFNNKSNTITNLFPRSLAITNGTPAVSYLTKHDIKGNLLLQNVVNTMDSGINTVIPAIPYIKSPSLNIDSSGNLIFFGNRSTDPTNSTENFFLTSLDNDWDMIPGAYYQDVTNAAGVPSNTGNLSMQARLIPSSHNTYYSLSSLTNAPAYFTSNVGTTQFTINEFSDPATKTANSLTLPSTKWYSAMANKVDSQGYLYIAQPNLASLTKIDIYKIDTNNPLSAASTVPQTFDMAAYLEAYLVSHMTGYVPNSILINPNLTNFFQVYVDTSNNTDNVYIYGTIPLGTSNTSSSPPSLPNSSIGFIAKYSWTVSSLSVSFICDSTILTKAGFELQNITVNDLATDNAGNIYAVGDLYGGASPNIFSTSKMFTGAQSAYIAKFSPTSIGATPLSPTFIKFLDGTTLNIKASSQSLLVFDENEIYVAGYVLKTADGPGDLNGLPVSESSGPYLFLTGMNIAN